METNYDKIIVLVIIFTTGFITWKIIKDFYITKFHRVFAHLIAVMTSSFMLLSCMFLFLPKNYQRGNTSDVEITFVSIFTIIIMLAVIYFFFKYLPSRKTKK